MRRRPSSEEAESRADRGRSAVCGSRECRRIAFIAAKFCALFRCDKFKGNGNGTLTVTMWRSMDEQVGVSRVAFGGGAPSQPQRRRFFCSMDTRKPPATSPKTPSLWIQRSSQPREQAKQFPGPSGKGNPELGERWGPRGRERSVERRRGGPTSPHQRTRPEQLETRRKSLKSNTGSRGALGWKFSAPPAPRTKGTVVGRPWSCGQPSRRSSTSIPNCQVLWPWPCALRQTASRSVKEAGGKCREALT
jgi:hypothetical protein